MLSLRQHFRFYLSSSPEERRRFKQYVKEIEIRAEQRRQWVKDQMRNGRGGEYQTTSGQKVILSPTTGNTPNLWRITFFTPSGEPSGHMEFPVLEGRNSVTSALAQLALLVKTPIPRIEPDLTRESGWKEFSHV